MDTVYTNLHGGIQIRERETERERDLYIHIYFYIYIYDGQGGRQGGRESEGEECASSLLSS